MWLEARYTVWRWTEISRKPQAPEWRKPQPSITKGTAQEQQQKAQDVTAQKAISSSNPKGAGHCKDELKEQVCCGCGKSMDKEVLYTHLREYPGKNNKCDCYSSARVPRMWGICLSGPSHSVPRRTLCPSPHGEEPGQ